MSESVERSLSAQRRVIDVEQTAVRCDTAAVCAKRRHRNRHSAMAGRCRVSGRSALLALLRMLRAVPRAVMGNVKSLFNRFDDSIQTLLYSMQIA